MRCRVTQDLPSEVRGTDEEREAPLDDLEAAGHAEEEVFGDGGASYTMYCPSVQSASGGGKSSG
jgi:hypothetical protein